MAGDGDRAAALRFLENGREAIVDSREVESGAKIVVDAVDQDVPVLRLDLARLQDQQPELIFEQAIVGHVVELPMFGENEAVERQRFSLDPLTVVLDLGAAIVRRDRMGVQIEDHVGTNLGTPSMSPLWASSVGTKSTRTDIPIETLSGSQPTMLVSSCGPSSSCTYATT